jgi:protein phosphatase
VWQAIILRQLNEEGAKNWGLGTREEIGTTGLGVGIREEEKTIDSGVEPSEKEEIGNQILENNTSISPSPFSEVYLDQEQRYKLLEPLPPLNEIAATAEAQVRVLDCKPFQLSPLEVNADSVMTMEIPAIAKTYLTLQSQFYEAVPSIHDAWQQDGIQVVLIADRCNWPELIQLWHDDQTTPLQILHWLYEMTQLWGALEPWHCRQSLLELSNLRVDEDGVLGLQRLYAEPDTGKSLILQDLGQVWQRLFQESQRTQIGSLGELLADLQSGSIQIIDNLRSRLEVIANELQANVPATPDLNSEPAAEAQSAATKAEVAATPKQSVAPTVLELDEAQDNLTKSDDMPTLVLPIQLTSLEDAGRTDVGRQRNHNEDFFGIETAINKLESPNNRVIQARGVYILCDGMGGHAGGEVASNLAVKTLQQYFQTHWQDNLLLPPEDAIREAVLLANQAIYDMNQQDARSGIGRMGTTLVMVLLRNTQVAVAHVGDSRLYRLSSKRGLEQVTMDHEVGQREILRGIEPEIAYGRPDAYQLTQALGPRDENFINPEVQFLKLNEDTLLLLTSDGLSDHDLLEHHWRTHLEPLLSSEASMEQGVSDLIDLANQYNGHDNITAVAIRVRVRPNQEQQARG